MNRITIPDLKSAIEKTHLKLKRCSFGDGATCGCPQTIMCVASGDVVLPELVPSTSEKHNSSRVPMVAATVDNWADKVYGMEYAYGFRHGFDNGKGMGSYGSGGNKYTLGVQDGIECWNAFLSGEIN